LKKNIFDKSCTITTCEIVIKEQTTLDKNMDTDVDSLDTAHRASKRP